MKRLLYDVSRWHLYLHREARNLRSADPADSPVQKLEDELFDALYAGERTKLAEGKCDSRYGEWAKGVHAALEALPSYERLARQCRGHAGAAAAAVESLLEELGPVAPPEQPVPPAPVMRRGASRACSAALKAVEELQEASEGLEHVAFGAGTEQKALVPGDAASYAHLAAALRTDSRLRELARLAGRFRRILADKRRSRVRHGADELTDIEQGDALARVLPSQLVALRHPKRRLLFFRDLLERRCLQYHLTGMEALGRGPLVVCLDKSGSMAGASDLWSTAVALALLDAARTQRRPFALVCFNSGVVYEAKVPAGGALPAEGLAGMCDGGTNIDSAIARALELIATEKLVKRADVVLVTDGVDTPRQAPALRESAKALEATIFGVGIDVSPDRLSPWCDRAVEIHSTETLDGPVAEGLAAI